MAVDGGLVSPEGFATIFFVPTQSVPFSKKVEKKKNEFPMYRLVEVKKFQKKKTIIVLTVGKPSATLPRTGPPVVVVVALPRYHLTMLNVQVQGHHHFRYRKVFLAHDFHQHRPFNVAKIGVLAAAPGRRQPKQIVVFAPLVQQFFLGDGGFRVICVFVISKIPNRYN
jgi:hypothetical protein